LLFAVCCLLFVGCWLLVVRCASSSISYGLSSNIRVPDWFLEACHCSHRHRRAPTLPPPCF
jgi:hypothetical protein